MAWETVQPGILKLLDEREKMGSIIRAGQMGKGWTFLQRLRYFQAGIVARGERTAFTFSNWTGAGIEDDLQQTWADAWGLTRGGEIK